jgi:predicted N-acetyltransferase YhbS
MFVQGDFSFPVSHWIESKEVRVYLRNTKISIDHRQPVTSIVIGNIIVAEEYRKQRLATSLISVITSFNNKELSVVECCHNPLLYRHLISNGWIINPRYYLFI